MAFSQMLEILKEKEKGTIVFVKLGSFYIAVGEFIFSGKEDDSWTGNPFSAGFR